MAFIIQTARLLCSVFLFLVLAAPVVSRADIIYSNLGPDKSYRSDVGFTEGTDFLDGDGVPDAIQGMPFIVPAGPAVSLAQIEIALTYVSGTNSALLRLMSDSGGLPGSSIASWVLSDLPDFALTTDTIQTSQTISGITGINLLGGIQYWLIPEVGADQWLLWNRNVLGPGGLFAQSFNGDPFALVPGTFGAFAVYGAVPEPSSLLLLGIGLLGLGGSLHRSKFGRQRARSC